MELLQWTEDERLDIAVIDDQHRQLVDLTNRLHGALHDRRQHAQLGVYLDELASLAETHFATEEQLMREHGVPGPAMLSHVREHEEFRGCLKQIKADLAAGAASVPLDLWQAVSRWWRTHGTGADRDLARAIHAKRMH